MLKSQHPKELIQKQHKMDTIEVNAVSATLPNAFSPTCVLPLAISMTISNKNIPCAAAMICKSSVKIFINGVANKKTVNAKRQLRAGTKSEICLNSLFAVS